MSTVIRRRWFSEHTVWVPRTPSTLLRSRSASSGGDPVLVDEAAQTFGSS